MKVFVVGLGPGSERHMTPLALSALKVSDVIVGYDTYIELIRDRFPDKEFLSTPMRGEVQRCRAAFESAAKGKTVSVVCSGDPGVYGMAGLCLEVAEEYRDVEVEIVAGITAACSGAALLGAPLGHDFAVISLSDLLTPWETIEKRLDAAGAADFCICLYNPSSKKRHDYLQKACDILLRHRSPENVAGVAHNIGREGEYGEVTTLGMLRGESGEDIDMFSTVFIGSSQTVNLRGRLVTPRGYRGVGGV